MSISTSALSDPSREPTGLLLGAAARSTLDETASVHSTRRASAPAILSGIAAGPSSIRSSASVDDFEAPEAPAPTFFARVCGNISNFFTAIFSKMASFFGNRSEQAEQAPAPQSPLEAARARAEEAAAAAAVAVARRDLQREGAGRALQAAHRAVEAVEAAAAAADNAIQQAAEAGRLAANLVQEHEVEQEAQLAAERALQEDSDLAQALSLSDQDAIAMRTIEADAAFLAAVQAASAEHAQAIARQ